MQSFHPKLVGNTNFDQVFRDFFETARHDTVQLEVVKIQLFALFGQMKTSEIQTYVKTYWPFYVYASWYNPNDIAPEVMIDNIAKQLPEAVRLGFDIFDKLMNYANIRITLEPDIKSFFSKTRDALEHSDWPIGKLPDQSAYTMGDCVKELALLESLRDNTIDYAKFYQKLSKLIFPNDLNEEMYKREYIYITTHKALEDLVNTILILTQQSPDDIYSLVDEYTHPEIYDPDYGAETGEPGELLDLTKNVEQPKEAEKPSAPVKPVEPPKSAKPVVPSKLTEPSKPSAPSKPSYAEIRDKIDAAFEKDADGNYEDLDLVMSALQKAAEKYNEPKIAELYYFDETAGKFKWNV